MTVINGTCEAIFTGRQIDKLPVTSLYVFINEAMQDKTTRKCFVSHKNNIEWANVTELYRHGKVV